MADSTPYVLAAGGVIFANRLLAGQTPDRLLLIGAGTAAAALVTAGLDVVLPGFGKGLGVLLVLGAVLREGPDLITRLPGAHDATLSASGLSVGGRLGASGLSAAGRLGPP